MRKGIAYFKGRDPASISDSPGGWMKQLTTNIQESRVHDNLRVWESLHHGRPSPFLPRLPACLSLPLLLALYFHFPQSAFQRRNTIYARFRPRFRPSVRPSVRPSFLSPRRPSLSQVPTRYLRDVMESGESTRSYVGRALAQQRVSCVSWSLLHFRALGLLAAVLGDSLG